MNNDKKLISREKLFQLIHKWLKPFIDEQICLGGYWCSSSNADSFYWHLAYSIDDRGRVGSSRLCDNHWEIYNSIYRDVKYTNIRIFNDHIEFIEDSFFKDFSKEEMYSLYTFLNERIFNNKEENNEEENVMSVISEYFSGEGYDNNNKNSDVEKADKYVEIYTKDDYISKHNKFGVDDLNKYIKNHKVWITLENNVSYGNFNVFHQFTNECTFSHIQSNPISDSNKSIDIEEKITIPSEVYSATTVILDINRQMKLSEILCPKVTFNKNILRPGMIIRFTLIDNRDIDDDDIFTEYDDCIGYITEVYDDYITIFNSCGLQCAAITIKREDLFNDDGTPTDLRLDIRIIDEEALYKI